MRPAPRLKWVAMMNRTVTLAASALAACTLSACAVLPSEHDPAKDQQYVSMVNSLSWINPMTGKRDGLRSSWPLKAHKGEVEIFPLAQIKHCEAAGAPCAWGVMVAQRKLNRFTYAPGGVTLELGLALDVDRRQEIHRGTFNAAMAIPSDIAALRWKKDEQRTLNLQYGRVERIEFDYGVRFEVCALRYDASGRALDICEIPYI
ncbi:hypothetical protein ACFDR9_000710 [Janthinobacterium sp. CG_23.3]|nr:hypothetical protein [Janthinobacterium sp. CG_S6]